MKKTFQKLLLLIALVVLGAAKMSAEEAYAVINIETDVMTFYYDNDRSTHESNQNEAVYSLNTGTNRPAWWGSEETYAYHVREVVFDRSFEYARPTSTYKWFGGMTLLTTITFTYYDTFLNKDYSLLNTSQVTNMSGMFANCESLTRLDLSSFDTSNVTDMSNMFQSCSGLTQLYGIHKWDTGNVTNMSGMFSGCSALTSLNVSNWNTAIVTNMSSMFANCWGITNLNLNNWETGNVTNMSGMFSGCSALTNINVRDWNTSSVTTMSSMFSGCSNLSSLNVKSWNTSRVTNMGSMFSGCTDLSFVYDITNLNTSSVTNMSSMFLNCSSFITLDLSNWNTSRVTNMSSMFSGCSELETIYVSNWNTSCVTNMSSMFSGCSGLTTIYAGDNWSTSAVTSSTNMFLGCTNLTGHNGTRYNGYYIDATYARFDNAPNSPGYLSDTNNIPPVTCNVSLRLNQAKAVYGDSTYVAEKQRLLSFTVEKGETFTINFQRLSDDYALLYYEENGQRTLIANYNGYTYSKTVNEDLYLECYGTPKNEKVTLQNSLGGSLKYKILRQLNASTQVELVSDSIDLASGYKIFSAQKDDILWLSVTPRADYRIGKVRCNGVEQSVVSTATDGSQLYQYTLAEDSVAVSVSYSKPKVNVSLYTNSTSPCTITRTYLNELTGRWMTQTIVSVTDGVASNSVNTPVLGEIGLKLPATPTNLYVNGVNRLADLSASNYLLLSDATTENDFNVVAIYEEEETPGILQTVTRHGGGMSQMDFEYEIECNAPCETINDGDCKQFYIPPYGADCETYFRLWIGLLDGETFKVYRNGEDYTDYFRKGTYNSNNKYTHYSFEDSYWINDNPEFWSSLREAATWEVFIEPATIDYTFIGNFRFVYATVDYGGVIDEPLDGWETDCETSVEGYYKGTIIENPMYKDADAAVSFDTANGESFRVFRNGEEVTDEFEPIMSAGSRKGWVMDGKGAMMHEPAQWVIITDSELSRYDVNRDKQISIADVTKLVNKILGKE